MMDHNYSKSAFTLAEVLITLGIIGVVAAMTMPSLMAKHQKHVAVTQLKRQVNIIENGVRRLLYEEGVDKISQSSLVDPETKVLDREVFKQYFKLSDMPENSKFNKLIAKFPGNSSGMYFNDGSCIAIADKDSSFIVSYVILDTNCDKGPNQWGVDRFAPWTSSSSNSSNLLFNESENCAEESEETKKAFKEMKDMKFDDEAQASYRDVLLGRSTFAMIRACGWKINYF